MKDAELKTSRLQLQCGGQTRVEMGSRETLAFSRPWDFPR